MESEGDSVARRRNSVFEDLQHSRSETLDSRPKSVINRRRDREDQRNDSASDFEDQHRSRRRKDESHRTRDQPQSHRNAPPRSVEPSLWSAALEASDAAEARPSSRVTFGRSGVKKNVKKKNAAAAAMVKQEDDRTVQLTVYEIIINLDGKPSRQTAEGGRLPPLGLVLNVCCVHMRAIRSLAARNSLPALASRPLSHRHTLPISTPINNKRCPSSKSTPRPMVAPQRLPPTRVVAAFCPSQISAI